MPYINVHSFTHAHTHTHSQTQPNLKGKMEVRYKEETYTVDAKHHHPAPRTPTFFLIFFLSLTLFL